MNRFIIFLLGFIAGGITLYFVEGTSSVLPAPIVPEKTSASPEKPKKDIQYIEVKGRKGEVTLHPDMEKDSVKVLVGKPSRVEFKSFGTDSYETWEYDFPGEGKYGTMRTLCIEFFNGKLKNLHDH